MSNLITSVNIMLPIVVLISIGVCIRALGLVQEATLREVDRFMYLLFLPVYLFNSIYQSDFRSGVSLWPVLYTVACFLIVFTVLWLAVPRLVDQREQFAAVIQSILRSNFLFYGFFIMDSLFGAEGRLQIALVVSFLSPLINTLAVIVCEYYRKGRQASLTLRLIVVQVLKNPLIIAAVLGLLCQFFEISLPGLVVRTIRDMSLIPTTLCFITLGGSLSFAGIRNKGLIAACVGFKLLAVPLVGLTVAALLGFRGVELAAIMVALASPTAIASFTMTRQYGGDFQLVAQVITATTVLSSFTFVLFTFMLKTLRLI